MNLINKIKNNKKYKFAIAVIVLIAVVICFIIGWSIIKNPRYVTITKKYNQAVNEYNSTLDKYNKITATSSVENIKGCKAPAKKLSLSSEKKEDIKKSLENGNSVKKIKKDTDTINTWIGNLKNSIEIAEQVKKPTVDWVKSKLSIIDKINTIETVTDSNVITKHLGENSNCSGIVYFSIKDIEEDSVEGKTIVEKGTDVGGCIEIYNNLHSAKDRCEYLGEFDGTYLYTGSYALIGTTVVRTSYRLEEKQQLELTNLIFEQMSNLE